MAGLKKSSVPLKKGSGLKSGRPLSKGKPKKKKKVERSVDLEVYGKIWEDRPHVCVSCDAYLGEELMGIFIEHILPKSTYPEYGHSPENIALVCANCHHLKENGFPTEKYKKIIDKVKKSLVD